MSKINLEKAKQILKEVKQLTPETIREGISIFNKNIIGKLTGLNGEEKTVVPSAFSHFITPDAERGYDGITKVIMPKIDDSIEPNLQSKNIKTGVSLFGIQGSCDPQIAEVQNKQLDLSSNGEYSVYPDYGYDGISSVKVNINVPPAVGGNMDTSQGTASSGSVSENKIGYVNGQGVVGDLKEFVSLKTVPMSSTLNDSKKVIKFETEKNGADEIYRQGAKIQGFEGYPSLANTIGVTSEKIVTGKKILGVVGTTGVPIETFPIKNLTIDNINNRTIDISRAEESKELGLSAINVKTAIKEGGKVNFLQGNSSPIVSATVSDEDVEIGQVVGLKMGGTSPKYSAQKVPVVLDAGETALAIHFSSSKKDLISSRIPTNKENYIILSKCATGPIEKHGYYIRLYEYNKPNIAQSTLILKQKILDDIYAEENFVLAGCDQYNRVFALDGEPFPILFIYNSITKNFKKHDYDRGLSGDNENRFKEFSGKNLHHFIFYRQERYELDNLVLPFIDELAKTDSQESIYQIKGSISLKDGTYSLTTHNSNFDSFPLSGPVITQMLKQDLDSIWEGDKKKNPHGDFVNALNGYWVYRNIYENEYCPLSDEITFTPQNDPIKKESCPADETFYKNFKGKIFTNLLGNITLKCFIENGRLTNIEETVVDMEASKEKRIVKSYNEIFYNGYNLILNGITDIDCSLDLEYMILNRGSNGATVLRRKHIAKSDEGTLMGLDERQEVIKNVLTNENDELAAFEVAFHFSKGKISFERIKDTAQSCIFVQDIGGRKEYFKSFSDADRPLFVKKIRSTEGKLNDIDGIGVALQNIPKGGKGNIQQLLMREESKSLYGNSTTKS